MSVLDAFKVKEFDLEPVFVEWSDPPRFLGNPKKDPPIDVWLDSIKAGCLERKVPKDYWHKVGQRFLGDRARARLDELKAVLRNMHGGKYRWDWKKFKVAMRNMGWDIDDQKTQSFKVQSKPSGLWWIVGGKDKQEAAADDLVKGPADKGNAEKTNAAKRMDAKGKPEKQKSVDSTSFGKSRKPSVDSFTKALERTEKTDDATSMSRSVPKRMTSWLSRTPSTSSTASAVSTPPASETAVASTSSFWGFGSNTPTPSSTPNASVAPTPAQSPGEVTTTVTNAPVWLLNACNSLEFLTTEHPKAMSTLSAVLITVGTLPAIPAISAGAGGALLASHAVQAAGAIAVGVGNWLKASQEASAVRTGNSGTQTPPAEVTQKTGK